MSPHIYKTLEKNDPPPGTRVRLLRDGSMGHKKGQIGIIVRNTETYKHVIEFDTNPNPTSHWKVEYVDAKDYEIVQTPKPINRKFKLKLK